MTGETNVTNMALIIQMLATIIGILATIWSIIHFTHKHLHKWIKIARSINRIHNEFGDSAFNTMVDIVQKNQVAIEQLYIRIHISERLHNIGIYVCNPAGECTWANDWLCEAFGIDSHKMHGFGWITAIEKNQQPRVYDTWTNAIKHRTPYIDDYTITPPNKTTTWKAHTEAWPIFIGEELIGYVGHILKTI